MDDVEAIGLCLDCMHGRQLSHPKSGTPYWLCERAADVPALDRYPRLPITACASHEPDANSQPPLHRRLMDEADTDDLRTALVQGWNVTEADDIVESLRRRVAFLLKHDRPRLISSLYLLDVSESKAQEALACVLPDESAAKLADCILEREIQKVETRKKYRRERSEDVNKSANDRRRLGPPN